MGAPGSGVKCGVCGETGGDIRTSQRFKVNVHQDCRHTCPACKEPKPTEGIVCGACEARAKAEGAEVVIPHFHAETDLSDRARNAIKSPITRQSYPVRIHERDDV